MDNFFSLWEATCSQTDQSAFNIQPISRHLNTENCFLFSDPYFVIVDLTERIMSYPEEIREIVLTLSNGPTNELRYIHCVDKWANMPFSIGMIISLATNSNDWEFMDDDQSLYKHKLACYINDSSPGLIMYPHYLFKISSFSCYKICPRAVFFRETHLYNKPTLNSLYGKFATNSLQRYVKNTCVGNNISAADIIEQLKREHLFQLNFLSTEQKEEKVVTIHSITDFYDQVDKIAQKIDEDHNVMMNMPHTKHLLTVSKASPGFGAKNYIEENTIWSFNEGLVGRPNCVVELDTTKTTDANEETAQNDRNNITSQDNANNDSLQVNTNNDKLQKNANNDKLQDNANNDTLQENANNDNLQENANNDNLQENANNDNLQENANNDNLQENANNDNLQENANNDNLQENANNDNLQDDSKNNSRSDLNGTEQRNVPNAQIVPIEVIGTIGKTNVSSIRNGQIFGMSAQNLLLTEKGLNSSYGFVWFVGSNQKFWVHPRPQIEHPHMRQVRNIVVCSIAEDSVPIAQVTPDCDTCISRPLCAFHRRMRDRREYIDKSDFSFLDIEDGMLKDAAVFRELLPDSMNDFSKNMTRVFYEHYHRQILSESLCSMWSSVRITTSPIEEREKQGHALSKLQIVKIESYQIPSKETEVFNLVLRPNLPGQHYRLRIARLDSVFITRNGQLPILALGNIAKIHIDYIVVSTYEKTFNVGERIAIDTFKFDNFWLGSDNEILDNLLTDASYSRIKNFLIDFRFPLFQLKPVEFNPIGLNNRQQEAVSKALAASDYFLINAPHGSGRIVIGLRIIDTLVKRFNSIQILVAPFYYATINKICQGLEILGIPYLVGGKIEQIKEEFRKNHQDFFFASCKTIKEMNSMLKTIKVFIITSTAKKFDILFQRNFDLVIMYEASRIGTIRAIPSLTSSCPFILFGDSVLDNDVDSIFSYFQQINGQQVLNLCDIYNCEPAIVAASRVAWGSELNCVSQHASISLKPLNILSDKSARKFFKDSLSMDKPIVFFNVPKNGGEPLDDKYLVSPSVLISIVASLVYSKDSKINVVTDQSLQPIVSSALHFCLNNPDAIFTNYAEHLSKAVQNIKYYEAVGVMSKRKDVCVALVGCEHDTRILTWTLGMTRRKLIFVGSIEAVYDSPLWATVLNTIPNNWIVDFPLELVNNEVHPFRALNEILKV